VDLFILNSVCQDELIVPPHHKLSTSTSGAGMNLKVGWHTSGAQRRKKNTLSRPRRFLALRVQLVVLLSAFVMVSTDWSVSCLLFFYSRCSQCPAICKSGERAPVHNGVGVTSWKLRHSSPYLQQGGGNYCRRKDVIVTPLFSRSCARL